MNPDAREAAARHLLGLMPPDESALHEAASAHDSEARTARAELEQAAAAIAVAACPPVPPPPGLWPRIQAACGIPATPRRRLRLIAWSGWAAAAALAVLLAIQSGSSRRTAPITQSPAGPVGGRNLHHANPERSPSPASPGQPDDSATSPDAGNTAAIPAEHPTAPPRPGQDPRPESGEGRRLIQEMATLRTELARFKDRDRQLFTAVPGRAWPVIIEMLPPSGSPAAATIDSALTTRLGHALAGMETESSATLPPDADPGTGESATIPDKPTPVTGEGGPRAIPVYDPARDTGTLAIHNLPPAPEGFEYNLWVSPDGNTQPVLAGTLPADLRPSDALDFSLGSPGILPGSYQLTMDSAGSPVAPGAANVILQGP